MTSGKAGGFIVQCIGSMKSRTAGKLISDVIWLEYK